MTEKTENATALAAEEGLVATCEGIVRDYLAHRGYEVHAAGGWSCDCEDAPIVAADGDETVLIAISSGYEEGSARMPELNVGAAVFAIMRRACLLYLADHGDVDAICHDVVSIVVTGERQARLPTSSAPSIGQRGGIDLVRKTKKAAHDRKATARQNRAVAPSCSHGHSQAFPRLPSRIISSSASRLESWHSLR